jgi:hypothetical protein
MSNKKLTKNQLVVIFVKYVDISGTCVEFSLSVCIMRPNNAKDVYTIHLIRRNPA